MKATRKKWPAVIVIFAMIFMMLPMTAFAADMSDLDYDSETNTYTLSGDYTIENTEELTSGTTLYVPEGCTLTVSSNAKLKLQKGSWLINDGDVIVNGELKSYGLTNFVKDTTWPKGEFMIQGGEWYNKNGSLLYVGGTDAGLELVDENSSMTATFVDGTLVMTAASGAVVQNDDKTLSSALLPNMINRLVISNGATYRVAEGKKLIIPDCGELVAMGTLEIGGSVILKPGSKYTLKNGSVVTMPSTGDSVTLTSGTATSLPAGTKIHLGNIVFDAGQAVLELDGSVSMENGDRITAQGDIIYHSVTITATANEGGSISPSGSVSVEARQNQTFTIAADDGYRISDVLVDSVSIGAVESYAFSDVSETHTIEAIFAHAAVKVAAKDPTCTENGNSAYWYCKVCDKYFSDEAMTKEITLMSAVIPAKGHGETEIKNAKEAACTEEGYTGDKVCKDCGEIVEQGKVVAKSAHIYKDGKCTECGAADTDYKSNGGKSNVSQTGDSNVMWLWLALLFVSGAGLAATAVYIKKEHAE